MRKINLIMLLSLSLLIFACQSKPKQANNTEEFTGSKYVKVEKVIKSDMESLIEYSGRIEAEKILDIAPILSLKIQNIYVKEGDFVSKGTLLASLDNNALLQFESNYKNAEKNYLRAQNLLKNNAIDQRSFDDLEALYISSKANYDTNLENLLIRAPFAGIITAITQKTGETYSPALMNSSGVNGLFRIMNLSTMIAKINIPDKDLPFIKKGNKVNITSDANPDMIFNGSVKSVLPEANSVSGLYSCEISINNSNNQLKHNQYARFNVVKQKATNTLIIPVSAVLDSNVVFTVVDNKAKKNIVNLGIINKQFVQIIDGLNVNDLVVTEGSLGLADGSSVIIK